jgi:hypothetical protein
MFSHYDRRGKCEWFGGGLEDFVSHYNRECDTNYVHTSCLDIVRISGTTLKQPEVLVTDGANNTRMVIERKSVVWPPDYILKHNNEHSFAETVWKATSGWYNDACYELIVFAEQMEELDSKTVNAIANEISSRLAHLDSSGIPTRGNSPVDWVFCRADTQEHGDRRGIVVSYQRRATFKDFLEDNAREGTASAIEKELSAAALKFVSYSDARRVVLLDFYGTKLWEQDIPPLMLTLTVPSNIDEVWMSKRDWVSEEEFEIGYERLFSRPISVT